MATLKAPKGIVQQIEKLIKNFLWRENMDDKRKIPLVSLENLCTNKNSGGAGMHNFSTRNLALGAKLVWRMYQNHKVFG